MTHRLLFFSTSAGAVLIDATPSGVAAGVSMWTGFGGEAHDTSNIATALASKHLGAVAGKLCDGQ
jgi:hypothetical protein